MTDSLTEEIAGRMLVSWAVREAMLREQVASDWPLHIQYAGDGELLAIAHVDAELVWPRDAEATP